MLSRRVASVPYSARGYATKVTATASEGKVSTLTVKVNAGSRYATKDGISHLLSRFNFQNTQSRSALRLTRESEVLGGVFSSKVERDAIYLSANFLKEALPYYVNAIADVLYKTSFRPHEFPEVVLPAAKYDLATALASPYYSATELAHAISFRQGLGNPLLYDGVEKISLADVKAFADTVYVKENVEVIAKGVDAKALEGFIKESALNNLPSGASLAASAAPKSYVGVETRQRAAGESVAVIAVPVKTADFATYEVLASFLTSPLTELSQAVSHATLNKYSQAGLFTLFVKGDAATVSTNVKKVAAALKGGVSLSSATTYASVKLALANESAISPVELDLAKIKDFKLGKFNFVALGDVNGLPYADEL